jgi:biofilm PGA synthesis lipoprotein PgaB
MQQSFPVSPSPPNETQSSAPPFGDFTEEVSPEESPSEEPAPLPERLPILMYHHVVPDGTTCNDMTVTQSKLASDFQWLNDHGYETILPSQLISGEPLPKKPILVTFDDGYRSNYELAYPLFQKYDTRAVISIMVYMQDTSASTFITWDMCREMVDSGLVEIGSHTYLLHNLDSRNGNFTPGGINGIQRKPEESDADFKQRVLDDLQSSHDLIEQNLGQKPTLFAYPFGIREKDAEPLIDRLFPVTVITKTGMADLSSGTKNLNRFTVTMRTNLSSFLQS